MVVVDKKITSRVQRTIERIIESEREGDSESGKDAASLL